MSAVEPPMDPPSPEYPVASDSMLAEETEKKPATIVEEIGQDQAETVNLVSTLSEKQQREYADRVVEDYERDMKSGEKFRERRARIVRLALGDIPPPKDGEKFRLARIHYPIIMTAVTRIGTRIYDQQFPSNGEYFGVKPTDALDMERAVRVAKHMNWQVAHQMPEYVPNHDVLIFQVLLYGSGFTRVYYDRRLKRPCHEVCATDDLVLPYTWKRGKNDPSMSQFPRITYLLRYYRDELEEMKDDGYYENVDKVFKPGQEDGGVTQEDTSNTPQKLREVTDRDTGLEKPADDPDAPRVVLYQCRKLKLPGSKKARPVVCEVDLNTRTLLCLKIREDAEPQDKARYNREKKANDAMFEAAMQQFQADQAAYAAGVEQMLAAQAATPLPVQGEMTSTAPPMPGAQDATMPGMPPAPTPPTKPADPEPPRMIPIDFFTHYVCFPNPEGVYGLGIGSLLEGINIAADTLASQVVDTGTLANTPTGYRSRQAKIRGGEFRFSPGEIMETDLSPEELKGGGGIQLLKFPSPEPALWNMIQAQIQEGEKLSGAGDILSGESSGGDTTATEAQILISQSLSQIMTINKRISRARTSEAQKIARLNSVYLDDVEYFYVIDAFKNVPPTRVDIGRMDYLMDTDVTVTTDPRMASQPQRIQEAMNAIQVTSQIPALRTNAPLWVALIKNLYTAMDRPDFIAAMEQGFGGAAPTEGMAPEAPIQTSVGEKQNGKMKPQPKPMSNRAPGPEADQERAAQEQGQTA